MSGRGRWRRATVAVTGMNAKPDNPGPGYAVARCLRESEFQGKLVGLGYDVLDPGLYARQALESGYLLPYPSAGHEALFERIEFIHRQEKIDVIIPTLDAEIASFICIEKALNRIGIQLLLPSLEALKMRDKDRLPQLCDELSLHHPRTRKVPGKTFFETCTEEGWEYPLVVKGPFYDAHIAYHPAQAQRAYQLLVEQWGYPVLVQEFVSGQELNLTALGDGRGDLIGTVMMAKRALTDKGKAWAGVSVVDKELEEMARQLASATFWKGPLEVEALRDNKGRLHLIEINPRFPAWIYLSKGVGRNLPLAHLQLTLGDEPAQFEPPAAGQLFIRYAEELVVDIATFETLMMQGHRTAHSLKEAV